MPVEIERKFLVTGDGYRNNAEVTMIYQGFLSVDMERVVRVRISGDSAKITIKGKSNGITRPEFEYSIPVEDAKVIVNELCIKPIIRKNRYRIEIDELVWEVDEFFDKNKGLVIAEVELPDENYEFKLPDWIGKEVTGDIKYYNANLIENPYENW